jgi:hypothetical protein
VLLHSMILMWPSKHTVILLARAYCLSGCRRRREGAAAWHIATGLLLQWVAGLKMWSGLHLVNLELARDVRQLAQVACRWTHNYATNHLQQNSAARINIG